MPTQFQEPPPRIASADTSLSSDHAAENSGLSELYQTKIEPIIKRLICAKLHVSLRPNDDSKNNQDALDLLSETKVLILQKLSSSTNGDSPIRDLEAYVRAVTANVFNQHLRRKYPRRLSLRNQLRYLFTHHAKLSLWRSDDNRSVCGLAGLHDGHIPFAIALSDEQRSNLQVRVGGVLNTMTGREITEFAFAVFGLHDRPAFFDDLVSLACEVLNVAEPVEVAEPENISEFMNASSAPSALSTLEDEELVRWLWHEILELPLRHRIAMLLNFKDEGDTLITILPAMRVASIKTIAAALEFDDDEFAEIWNELPWDHNRIAEHLGLTRQQVINLRQSARQTLRRKLDERK